MIWYDTMQHNALGYDVIWYDRNNTLRYRTLPCDTMWYHTIWQRTWYDITQYDMKRHDIKEHHCSTSTTVLGQWAWCSSLIWGSGSGSAVCQCVSCRLRDFFSSFFYLNVVLHRDVSSDHERSQRILPLAELMVDFLWATGEVFITGWSMIPTLQTQWKNLEVQAWIVIVPEFVQGQRRVAAPWPREWCHRR